jgi:AraC-like DNA-binding protein/tetratricopeptide (TPR) repeat protein
MNRASSELSASQAHPAILPNSLRKALAFLRANFRRQVRLSDIASASGLSPRALLRQFKCFLGVPPIAHLLRIRLTEVRAELLQSDGTASLSDIVSRCGITHMGRFATEYRMAFGELPSATLRRASESRASTTVPAPSITRQRPLLMILPLRTGTLPERHLAQELMEQVMVALSRARVAELSFDDPAIAISRRAAWSHKGSAAKQYCLHGRLTQRDDRIRVTLWLVDADGLHVWGDSYGGRMDDLFGLSGRVADAALLGVVPAIAGAEIDRIRRMDPRMLAAREVLMQAVPVLLKTGSESARKGIAIASHAVELDPDDALPFAWGAYCQARLFNSVAEESVAEARNAAMQLSARAVALDAGDPLVVTARAAIAALLELPEDIEGLLERALAMDPASGWAHERAGFLVLRENPDAAIACFDRAIKLHGPFMPRENCLIGIAQAHQCAGRSDKALHWIRRALAENPRSEVIHRFLVAYEERAGHHAEARRLAADICRAHPEMSVSRIAACYPHVPVEYLLRAGIPL